MQNVWVVGGGVSGRHASFEYYADEESARARVIDLDGAARRAFEELDARVDLGVTWEQYREIQNIASYWVQEIPHVESQNPHDDRVVPTGAVPTDRIWLILEDGQPEEERGYEANEQDAKDTAWSRKWTGWENYESSVEASRMTFAEYREEDWPSVYDYAPADPGPA